MIRWIKQLDDILRGQATRLSSLRDGTIDISARGLCVVLLILGMLYGLCMGFFSILVSSGRNYQQIIATTVKVPTLETRMEKNPMHSPYSMPRIRSTTQSPRAEISIVPSRSEESRVACPRRMSSSCLIHRIMHHPVG